MKRGIQQILRQISGTRIGGAGFDHFIIFFGWSILLFFFFNFSIRIRPIDAISIRTGSQLTTNKWDPANDKRFYIYCGETDTRMHLMDDYCVCVPNNVYVECNHIEM